MRRGENSRNRIVPAVLAAAALSLGAAAPSAADDRPPWTQSLTSGDLSPSMASRQQALATDDLAPVSAIVFPTAGAGICRRDLVGSLVDADGLRAAGTQSAIGPEAAGDFVGGAVGRAMDALDHRCVGQVLEYVPNGRAIMWRSPDMGTVFRVTAVRTYAIGGGRYCREFLASAAPESEAEISSTAARRISGTACRSAAGEWRAAD